MFAGLTAAGFADTCRRESRNRKALFRRYLLVAAEAVLLRGGETTPVPECHKRESLLVWYAARRRVPDIRIQKNPAQLCCSAFWVWYAAGWGRREYRRLFCRAERCGVRYHPVRRQEYGHLRR